MIAACAASRGWRKDGEAANEASREYVIVNSAGFEACRGERVKKLLTHSLTIKPLQS